MLDSFRQVAAMLQAMLSLYLYDPRFYLQLALFLAISSLAWLLARQLRRGQWRLPGLHWQTKLQPFYFPLFGLLGGRVVSLFLRMRGEIMPIFERLYELFWVLLLYRLALVAVRRFWPDNAALVRQRILLPLALLFILLRLAGQLKPFLTVLNSAAVVRIGDAQISLAMLIFGPLAVMATITLAQGLRAILTDDILPQAGLSVPHSYAVGTLASYAIIVGGVLFTLAALGIDLSTLTVIGGALAVGAGLGLQNTVNNFVSGFLIMFDPLLRVGDLIEVASERGTIRHIGIRNTMIETRDGTRVVMPNATLASSPILNLSQSSRAVKSTLSWPVPITTDPGRMEARISRVLAAHPSIREEPPPSVVLKSFDEARMIFEATFWATSAAHLDQAIHEINLALWNDLHDLGEAAPPAVTP